MDDVLPIIHGVLAFIMFALFWFNLYTVITTEYKRQRREAIFWMIFDFVFGVWNLLYAIGVL